MISVSALHAADMADGSYGKPTRISFAEIEARAGAIWLGGNEVDGGEDNQMLFGGAALRAGMVFENRWIIQGDVFGELTDSRDDDSYVYGIGVAAHIAKRFDTYLLGIFGGYLHTDQDDDNTDISGRAFAGLEAQRYFDDVTLYGQAGWLGGEWGNDADGKGDDSLSRAAFANAMIRYFVNPATRLDLSAAGFYGYRNTGFENETRGGSLTAAIEHQISDSALSVFSGYEFGYYFERQGGEPEEVFESTIWAGLKYRFGVDGTLKQQDMDRPNLGLPPFLRWLAQTGGPLG